MLQIIGILPAFMSPMELGIIFLIIIVLFGATRLPQLGRGLGEGISNFKRGLKSGEADATLPDGDAPENDANTNK